MKRDGRKRYPPLRKLTSAEQELVTQNTGLARKEANRVASAIVKRFNMTDSPALRRQFHEELIGHAMIGLCIAAQRFDPARGYKFSTFAYHSIRGQVGRGAEYAMLRYGKRIPGVTVKESRYFLNSENPDGDWMTDIYDPREEGGKWIIPEPIRAMMGDLLDNRRAMIVERIVSCTATLQQIGDELSISKERIRQLYWSGIATLQKKVEFTGIVKRLLGQKQTADVKTEVGKVPVRIA